MLLKTDPDSVNTQQLISMNSFDEAISSTAYVLVGFGGLTVLEVFKDALEYYMTMWFSD